jgi:hypothetical protein
MIDYKLIKCQINEKLDICIVQFEKLGIQKSYKNKNLKGAKKEGGK